MLLLSAVSTLLLAVPTVASASCGDENADSYTLQLASARGSYARGKTATVVVKVDHASDVGDRGSPLESGVAVSVLAEVGDALLWGGGKTNDLGIANVKVRIRRNSPLGKADVSASVRERRASVPCLPLDERGYQAEDALFTVTR